jgi:hypothetical protein
MIKIVLCVIAYILLKIVMLPLYGTIIKFSLRKLSVVICAVSETQRLGAVSDLRPGGRWFKSTPATKKLTRQDDFNSCSAFSDFAAKQS